jgi:hypothetical protein
VERGVELAVGFERELDDTARTAQSLVTAAYFVDFTSVSFLKKIMSENRNEATNSVSVR